MICSTIREILVQSADRLSNKDAIRYKKGKDQIESKNYTQLKEDSERFSAVLKTLGEQGQHIAVVGATSYEWLVTYFGTVNSGSVAVPLDVLLPVEEMCELVDRSDATVFVVDEVRSDVLAVAKGRCPKLKYVISMQKTESADGILSFWQLMNAEEPGSTCEVLPDQLATIMFTSGTTGKSKGVMPTHRNLAENATCLDMKIPEDTVLLSVLPIHHAYCLTNDFLKGLSNGSTICSGGAYLPPVMLDLFKKYDIDILQGYGMTECAPVISTTVSWNIRKGSVGQLMPNCEAKTVDEELWVRGSSVRMAPYR